MLRLPIALALFASLLACKDEADDTGEETDDTSDSDSDSETDVSDTDDSETDVSDTDDTDTDDTDTDTDDTSDTAPEDVDEDGYAADVDCDDDNAAVNPGATEVCNGADDDCDSETDEDVTTAFYADADNDTFGDPAVSVQACAAPSGHVDNDDDCDDAEATTYPGAVERPGDGVDNDCVGGDLQPLVYVTDRDTGVLTAINRVTGEIEWTADFGTEGIDVTVGPDGLIYVGDYGTGAISTVDPDTQAVSELVAAGGVRWIHGLRYDFENDVLLATSMQDRTVYEVDPLTGATEALFTTDGTLVDAVRLPGDDRVWFTERQSAFVGVYDPADDSVTALVHLPLGPNLITPSASGGLYVSAVGAVYEVDVWRRRYTTVWTGDLQSYGSCGDPHGGDNLILGDHMDAVWTLNTTTGALVALAEEVGITWGCAFSNVHDQDNDGHFNVALGGDDCDDLNANAKPGGTDTTVDGVDQDCDGVDGLDADGDGDVAASAGGTDCDDADPAVFVGVGACAPAASCDEIRMKVGDAPSGVYKIAPSGVPAFDAYCDMATDGGGWTLIAKVHRTTSSNQDEPDDWFTQLRDVDSLLDNTSYNDRTTFAASHGQERIEALQADGAYARVTIIAETEPTQTASWYKATAPDMAGWFGALDHTPTRVCSNVTMTANCSDGKIWAAPNDATWLEGMNLAHHGYPGGGPIHLRTNNAALGAQFAAVCSYTSNDNGNAWKDLTDTHWGNGLSVWIR